MRARRLLMRNGSTRGRRRVATILTCVLLLGVLHDLPGGLRGSLADNAARPEGLEGGRGEAGAVSGDGIKEVVSEKYLKRYRRWKDEYLSTEAGRRQWARYARDEGFMLTIIIAPELGQGGIVNGYRWDETGKLVAATINLGSGLDDGALPSFYYPVTSALAPVNEPERVRGEILAAAKLAHEFGHVNRAAEAGANPYQLQNDLIPVYAKLFKENGYNGRDPQLAELARRMGGTPPEIKRAREYAAEANALVFLEERMSGEDADGALFRRIKKSVKEYADGHIQLSK